MNIVEEQLQHLKQNIGNDGINCCRRNNNISSKRFSNIYTIIKYILNKLFGRYKFIQEINIEINGKMQMPMNPLFCQRAVF